MVKVIITMLLVAFFVWGCDQAENKQKQKMETAVSNSQEMSSMDDWLKIGEKENIDVASNILNKNYYFVLDGSGSMKETNCSEPYQKMDVAKNAVNNFAKAIPNDANLGLLVFDKNGVVERVRLGVNNREKFTREVMSVLPNSGTPLKDSLDLAYKKLIEQGKRQLGYGEYHIVIVTDGAASKEQDPSTIVETIAKKSPVIIHTIGFCIDSNHSLNQKGITLYKTAGNEKELIKGLSDVLAESPDFNISEFN